MMNTLITSSICILVAVLLLRAYIKGSDILLDPHVSASGKIIIVTGANTGIGKETVHELARRGGTIYMACRSLARCHKARNEIIADTGNQQIHCHHCDLADFDSIRQFVQDFMAVEGRLDVLINNAGIMHTPLERTKQGFELQFGVNHVGHFLLTKLLLDILKKSSPSRIVIVSSKAHESAQMNFDDLNSEMYYSPYQSYMQSKLANILFANHLAKKLALEDEGEGESVAGGGARVTVNSLHPGAIDTELFRHHGFLEENPVGTYLIRPFLAFIAKTPSQGALTSIYLALEPSLENVTGKYFSDCTEKIPAPQARSVEDGKRLWDITEKWVQEKS